MADTTHDKGDPKTADKSYLDVAGEKVSAAASTTVGTVKEHPVAAAAIAAGAAAVVAGATFGVSKLREGEAADKKPAARKPAEKK